MAESSRKGLLKDTRGAALAEFVIAVVPLMTAFFCFFQLSVLGIVRLIVQHSAIIGARSASVISNEHQNTSDEPTDDDGNKNQIRLAVWWSFGFWYDKFEKIDVEVEDRSSCDDPFGPVTVRVSTAYRCEVPLGKLICQGDLSRIKYAATMPHQGSLYAEGGGANCK